MKVLAIIPARYDSARLPGKPLLKIGDKSMIQRVYERVQQSNVTKLVVATDDMRIVQHVQTFGNVQLTASSHLSGTDRCWEVVQKLDNSDKFDLVLNVQGDEPFIHPQQINDLIDFSQKHAHFPIVTQAKVIQKQEVLCNPNVVKLIIHQHRAIYFSRHPIPYLRGVEKDDWLKQNTFYNHIGIYGFRYPEYEKLFELSPTILEKMESLEQLRWLANGYKIGVCTTRYESLGIDTIEDLKQANLEVVK